MFATCRFGSLHFDGQTLTIVHKRGGWGHASVTAIPAAQISSISHGELPLRERWVRFSVPGQPMALRTKRKHLLRDDFALIYWEGESAQVEAILAAIRDLRWRNA